jgi:hypothetical protein
MFSTDITCKIKLHLIHDITLFTTAIYKEFQRMYSSFKCQLMFLKNIKKNTTVFLILLSALMMSCGKVYHEVYFESSKVVSDKIFATTELNSELPTDWSKYNFMILDIEPSFSQRFEIGLRSNGKYIIKRLHPMAGARTRIVMPLSYYRAMVSDGQDMASIWNHPRDAGWINMFGGHGPIEHVDSILFRMVTPIGNHTLKIYAISVSKTDPGDKFIYPKKLIDKFGQWIPIDWDGKITSDKQLRTIWDKEDKALYPGDFNYDKWGGYLNNPAKITGFFHVEKI